MQTCLEEASNAGPEVRDRVLATLKLTSALRRKDLHIARFKAKRAAELAGSLVDEPDYLTVANANVQLIQRMIDSTPVEDLELSVLENGPLTPELELYFRLAQLESEIWAGGTGVDLKRILDSYRGAAKQCNDPYLAIQQKAIELYVQVYKLELSPLAPEIVQLQDDVFQESTRLDFQTGRVVALLVKSSGLRQQERLDEQTHVLGQALKAAQSSSDTILTIRCHKCLGIAFQENRDWDKTRKYYSDALELAENLGSQPLAISLLTSLMAVEMKTGRPEAAAAYKQRLEAYAAYQRLGPITKNGLNRFSGWLHHQLGNSKQVDHYGALVFPPAAVAAIKSLQDDNEAKLEKILDQEQQNRNTELLAKAQQQRAEDKQRKLQASHEKAAAEAEQTLSFFKRYSIFTTLLVLLLAPWLILFLMRSKLRFLTQALDSERITSRRSQVKCDELANRLHRLQRMESLGLMAGSVAHDFNNILVGVMGNAEVIQLKQETDPAFQNDEFVQQRISSIIKSAEKAASLSRQMLAYTGKQYIAREPIDLNEVICQYEPVLRSACRQNQQLILELSDDPIVSKVDITQVEQVILNLVTNSVEASSNDGVIRIVTGLQTVDDVAGDCSLHGTRSTGGEFCFIDVIDSGRGISQRDIDRIFEPFFSNSTMGRGLGLSVVYGAIISHDGFIKCTSDVGKGTTFRCLLPVSSESSQRQDSESTINDDEQPIHNEFQEGLPSLPAKKVLVIDDEQSVLELCAQLIQLNGWEVITACGGVEGLQVATQVADELSCILVDVVMPEMGASELLRGLNHQGINVPVVIMSGFSHTRLEFFLEKPNVIAVVEKPFRVQQIKQAIQYALDCGHGQATGYVVSARVPGKKSENPK